MIAALGGAALLLLGRCMEEHGLSDRQPTDASDRSVDARGVLVHPNDRFSTSGAGRPSQDRSSPSSSGCRASWRRRREHRPLRRMRARRPPTHLPGKGPVAAGEPGFRTKARTSVLMPARRPISSTVSGAITEMLASSKMPCFNSITSREPRSRAQLPRPAPSPKRHSRRPACERAWKFLGAVVTSVRSKPEQFGKLARRQPGNPLGHRAAGMRGAGHPRGRASRALATSRRSPPIDFTG